MKPLLDVKAEGEMGQGGGGLAFDARTRVVAWGVGRVSIQITTTIIICIMLIGIMHQRPSQGSL